MTVVSRNAGYGLFGAAEELTDEQIEHQINTNLVGSTQVARAALPHLRAQGGGRIIQISTYGGQATNPGATLYNASKFNIGATIIEPGIARTDFRSGSSRLAAPLSAYDGTPASFAPRHQDCYAPLAGRPGTDGDGHHRQRRAEPRAAAHRLGHRRLRLHPNGPVGAPRRARSPAGPRVVHRLPRRRMRTRR